MHPNEKEKWWWLTKWGESFDLNPNSPPYSTIEIEKSGRE